jgi:branched-chain amino acid transport system substrate-binding protein
MIMSGASFATELNDPKKYPYQFIAGPDYTEQFGILLRYIAQQKPGAKVAFVHSDTEFGRDPVESSRGVAKAARARRRHRDHDPAGRGRRVDRESPSCAARGPTSPSSTATSSAPIPEFIGQARQMGLDTQFMGTFWTMDNSTVMQMGEARRRLHGRDALSTTTTTPERTGADAGQDPRRCVPSTRTSPYIQGFLTAMLYAESAKPHAGRRQGDERGKNLKAALNSIKNFDTGGLIGVPSPSAATPSRSAASTAPTPRRRRMVPASDWIVLE